MIDTTESELLPRGCERLYLEYEFVRRSCSSCPPTRELTWVGGALRRPLPRAGVVLVGLRRFDVQGGDLRGRPGARALPPHVPAASVTLRGMKKPLERA